MNEDGREVVVGEEGRCEEGRCGARARGLALVTKQVVAGVTVFARGGGQVERGGGRVAGLGGRAGGMEDGGPGGVKI